MMGDRTNRQGMTSNFAAAGRRQRVCILGSTGSVGISTLNVLAAHPEHFEVFALTANTGLAALYQQCLQYKPRFAVLADAAAAKVLQQKLAAEHQTTTVLSGVAGLEEVAAHEAVDTVMAAIVGGAGLRPTLAAAQVGKKLLLANKEALVMAGGLFMRALRKSGASLLPIDSEHNAIFQCLPVGAESHFSEEPGHGIEKIVLTASGGPFLRSSPQELACITPEQACRHPNWDMGPKISVDSASMINKALELIEASILFNISPERISVLVHPQSIVHSMVYYVDGSVLAQLGNPDMRTPIAYGLAWPQRIAAGVRALDLAELASLSFENPDEARFPGLRLGRQAAAAGGSAPIILNAANEVAVAAFLAGRLGFSQIPVIIEAALQKRPVVTADSLEEVLAEDAAARALSLELLTALT